MQLIVLSMKNKYIIRSGISERKFREILRLTRFRGIHKHLFYYHLKECEFRFHMRYENIYPYLLKSIRNRPLKVS